MSNIKRKFYYLSLIIICIVISVSIFIFFRNWDLICVPINDYLNENKTYFPIIMLLVSILISGFFIYTVHKNFNIKDKIEQLVEQKTKELRESEERFKLAINGADLGIWDWYIKTGDVYFNERWARMLGYELDEIEPNVKSWELLLNPDDQKVVMDELTKHLEGKIPIYKSEHRLKTKDGKWKWVLDTGKVFERDENGEPIRATGVHLDIDVTKNYQEKLEDLSNTDYLTGLFNRKHFFERFNEDLEKFNRGMVKIISAAIIDIDHFKKINDTYGHQAGDYILKHFSDLLKENRRKYDHIGRYGGEEFVILFLDCDKNTAQSICEKVKDRLAERKTIFENIEINYTFSAGISDTNECSIKGCDPLGILKISDDRLYKAKETGRNKIIVD